MCYESESGGSLCFLGRWAKASLTRERILSMLLPRPRSTDFYAIFLNTLRELVLVTISGVSMLSISIRLTMTRASSVALLHAAILKMM